DTRDEARRRLRHGEDPGAARRMARTARVEAATAAGQTFEAVATEWLGKHTPRWSAGHAGTVADRLQANVFPWLGQRPVAGIESSDIRACIVRIEERGAPEVARRVLQVCGQVFAYAVLRGLAARNPAADLRGLVPPSPKRNFAALTDPRDVGMLLRAIDGYQGAFITRCALKFAPLVFVRPGELRHAEWSEFTLDGDNPEWRIPAAKMKARDMHIVPLSRQAVAVLRELHPLTGRESYVFPGERSRDRPMSENTVLAALRRLGYGKDEMTGHGFRSVASTLLHERGYPSHVIEAQLAHAERNAVKAAYNRAAYLSERRKLMQDWADYLDSLRNDSRPRHPGPSTSVT
ncbi:MAG: site-specific integrase, partial [Caldilineaceae bacterium]|nr:site-specific integrase [Caldilineaceae bacterium]